MRISKECNRRGTRTAEIMELRRKNTVLRWVAGVSVFMWIGLFWVLFG